MCDCVERAWKRKGESERLMQCVLNALEARTLTHSHPLNVDCKEKERQLSCNGGGDGGGAGGGGRK